MYIAGTSFPAHLYPAAALQASAEPAESPHDTMSSSYTGKEGNALKWEKSQNGIRFWERHTVFKLLLSIQQ